MPTEISHWLWRCPTCQTIISKEYSACPLCELKKKSDFSLKKFRYSHSPYSKKQIIVIRRKLPTLNPKEMRIIKMRTGLNGQPVRSLRFVGEIVGMSQENVRLIEKRVLVKIFNKNIPVLNGKT